MTSPLPAKLYFRIGEVAGLVGVEPHVLRYWEREFRSIRPTKSAKGQRVYSRKDVEALLVVKDLLYAQGFTIAGAKKKLQRPPQDAAHLLASLPQSHAAHTMHTAHTTDAAQPHAEPHHAPAPQAGSFAQHAPAAPEVSLAPHAALSPQHSHASPRTAHEPPPRVLASEARDKLVSLRSEIEDLLRELGG